MLAGMGADIKRDELEITLEPMKGLLAPLDIDVPNDPSSAFFFVGSSSHHPKFAYHFKKYLAK